MPGGAEVHAEWADVWYVLRGKATLVTGGSVVEGVTTRPGEINGKAIVGGDERQLKGGEVVVIPSGVPHWISKVQGEVVYLVVKAPMDQRPR
jgi:mannose-6-phosphate isomerase-like protein (cupin superfamily)